MPTRSKDTRHMKKWRDMLTEDNREKREHNLKRCRGAKEVWRKENNKFCLGFKIEDKRISNLVLQERMKTGKMLMSTRRKCMRQPGTLMFLILKLRLVKLIKTCLNRCKIKTLLKLSKSKKQLLCCHRQAREHWLIWFSTSLIQETTKTAITWMHKAFSLIKEVSTQKLLLLIKKLVLLWNHTNLVSCQRLSRLSHKHKTGKSCWCSPILMAGQHTLILKQQKYSAVNLTPRWHKGSIT